MRSDYSNDRNTQEENSLVCIADLQKVLLLPILSSKECVFKSRLVCFNETFGTLSNGSDVCVLYHEGISGRKADSIISSFNCFIQQNCCGIENLTIWCDNCCAQNKNWRFFLALLIILNLHTSLKTITIKYLEKGHTYMRSDCIHGAIGKHLKKSTDIFNFEDLHTIITSSMGNLKSIIMDSKDLLKWPEYSSQTGIPKIRQIRIAQL